MAELCHAYGFLAVFVAALVVRQKEHAHGFHAVLDTFAHQCETLLMASWGDGLVGQAQAQPQRLTYSVVATP